MSEPCVRCKKNDQAGKHLLCVRCSNNEAMKLGRALDKFRTAMFDRLCEKLNEGFTGWDGEYDIDDLMHETFVDAKDMFKQQDPKNAVDIANRCMMIWAREQMKGVGG